MILPQEHDYLSLSEEALLTQGFFVHEYIHWQLSSFIEISLLCIHADTVTIPNDKRPLPPPLKDYQAHNYSRGALCQSDGRQNGRRGCAFDNELEGCQHQ